MTMHPRHSGVAYATPDAASGSSGPDINLFGEASSQSAMVGDPVPQDEPTSHFDPDANQMTFDLGQQESPQAHSDPV